MKTVLFLCTGNYYRSRYAEIYFNWLAAKSNLEWRADSRGLAVELGHHNIGLISPFTLQRCEFRGIPVAEPVRAAQQVELADFEKAALVVAMYDTEHRPFVAQKFPAWLDRIEFWQVADVHEVAPELALPAIEKQVENLIARL